MEIKVLWFLTIFFGLNTFLGLWTGILSRGASGFEGVLLTMGFVVLLKMTYLEKQIKKQQSVNWDGLK